MTRLALAALLLSACGDNLPVECEADPAWAEVVVWRSPAVDCATACGEYRPGSGTVEAVCVFGGER